MLNLDNGYIDARIYWDQDVYESESRAIFGRAWLFVAHESQLSRPGDFFASYMGDDPIVVTRQKDGTIAAFLNQCRHRGMRICRADLGNAKSFTCTYHGWNYGLDGSLASVPHQAAYGVEFDRGEWGARQVPRVDIYKGLVFATWDADAVDLQTYMGPMADYLDTLVDRLDGGTEVIAGVHRWEIACNWKIPAEQFVSDMYHRETTHVSALSVFTSGEDAVVDASAADDGIQFWCEGGHGGGYYASDEPQPPAWLEPLARSWFEDTHSQVEKRLGRDSANRASGHNTLFPNFSWLNGTNTIRVWHPRGPNRVEVWSWVLVDSVAPLEVKDAFRRGASRAFGPSGVVEQDDGENWVEIQRTLAGSHTRRNSLCYAMGDEVSRPERTDRGTVWKNGLYSDAAAHNFYRQWSSMMNRERGE